MEVIDMARAATNSHSDIHSALKKLKTEANASELELIEFVAKVYENLREKKDQAVEKVKDTTNAVNTSVHLYPWSYVGGAALCGLVAGFLLRRTVKK